MRIQSAKELFSERLKILVYGKSGAGKTYLARTIEEPTLVVSAESGLLSIAGSEIDVIDITTDESGKLIPAKDRYAQLQKAYSFLQSEAARKYKWIFVDSLTEISQNLLESLQPEFPDRKDALVMYGENFKRMRNLIKAFRDIPHFNVVFTALAEEEKDQNGRRYNGISMIGKMANQLPAFFDEVFYLHTYQDEDVVKRKLVTLATDKAIAKDRSGKLNQFEDANLQQIANKIRGNHGDQLQGRDSSGRISSASSGQLPSASGGGNNSGHEKHDGKVREGEVQNPSSGQKSNGSEPRGSGPSPIP